MLTAGQRFVYALISHEIARHHDPYLVLDVLRHTGKYITIAIVALIISFGTGAAVMRMIQKHATQKEIDEALAIVYAMKGAENGDAL